MSHTRSRFRVLTRLAFASLAVTLLAAGARAEPAEDMKAIRELLTKIETRLANQQAANDVLLDIIRKDLSQLRDDVSRLQRELADVRTRGTGTTTISGYRGGPSASLSVGPPAPMATLRLVNTHFIPMSAVINGALVTVPPGQEQNVTVPAGLVNYQVFQVPEPMKSRTLVPNETLTLTLFPR